MLGRGRRRLDSRASAATGIGRARPDASSTRAAVAGPDAGQQLHDAETGDPVARIFRPAQERQHILDVRGFEELQAAEFHERNVAAGQFDFERAGVVRGAEQHRLRLERDARASRLSSTCSTT